MPKKIFTTVIHLNIFLSLSFLLRNKTTSYSTHSHRFCTSDTPHISLVTHIKSAHLLTRSPVSLVCTRKNAYPRDCFTNNNLILILHESSNEQLSVIQCSPPLPMIPAVLWLGHEWSVRMERKEGRKVSLKHSQSLLPHTQVLCYICLKIYNRKNCHHLPK